MSKLTFQPMVIPTGPKTPTMASRSLFAPEAINGTGSASSSYSSKRSGIYRGASVEDMQLPPAFALSKNQQVINAIELAYDREFSYIPILDKNRRPLGYVDVAALKKAWEADEIDANDQVINLTTKFDRSRTRARQYQVITPDTPLEILEEFLQTNEFALVTDAERKFVLAIATAQDLENFVTRRGKNAF